MLVYDDETGLFKKRRQAIGRAIKKTGRQVKKVPKILGRQVVQLVPGTIQHMTKRLDVRIKAEESRIPETDWERRTKALNRVRRSRRGKYFIRRMRKKVREKGRREVINKAMRWLSEKDLQALSILR